MLKKINKILFLVIVLNFITGCNPQKEYNTYILKQGYIPFMQPLADIGVGALIAGTPQSLRFISPPKTCFPNTYNGINTEIRQVTAADLPEIAKNISLNAGVDANVIAANGTPLFKLKGDFHLIKSLDVHIQGASIEYLDELVFADWVNSGMSSSCKNYLIKGGSFIRQALRVDKMSFQFKNSAGGQIVLTADNIKSMIDLDANIKWEISNSYTLTITTPKYIGYHLAKVSPQDPSSIALIASSLTPEGQFNFIAAQAYRIFFRGLMIK
ncbi:MAG: hypothetical protein Q7U04_15825 [Bacteriovorax sp.]|nr:hypothetical protein [Bacteriovorax sp.]